MFSLCIPTMDRFDKFLCKSIEKYITNNLIDEIIITDENGADVDKIMQYFPNNSKLVLVKNDYKLGPFLNKLKACKLAKNEWIVLMDSDNFADENYFITAQKYINEKISGSHNVILAPFFAKPNFNYTQFSGMIIKPGFFETNREIHKACSVLMNTGNYVINKYLIENVNIEKETHNISQSSSCDVIYFNTLLFEQLDLNLHVVPGLEYDHIVHDGSIYTNTCNQYRHFANLVHNRFYNLK